MVVNQDIIQAVNVLGRFCGKRDVETLASPELEKAFGIRQADIMVLFGGSVLEGGDVLARAMENRLARRYVIVGGRGHTTETLCRQMEKEIPSLQTEGLSEAELFQCYLKNMYGREADWLETRSTNCGNNILYLLELLKEKKTDWNSILICQDATMQLRMEAGLKKYISADKQVINYAAYRAEVQMRGGKPVYRASIHGMWDVERYVRLLMGEIPRLTDDENGYGPKGKNFISHVDIPEEVREAFAVLKKENEALIRKADPLYATV